MKMATSKRKKQKEEVSNCLVMDQRDYRVGFLDDGAGVSCERVLTLAWPYVDMYTFSKSENLPNQILKLFHLLLTTYFIRYADHVVK